MTSLSYMILKQKEQDQNKSSHLTTYPESSQRWTTQNNSKRYPPRPLTSQGTVGLGDPGCCSLPQEPTPEPCQGSCTSSDHEDLEKDKNVDNSKIHGSKRNDAYDENIDANNSNDYVQPSTIPRTLSISSSTGSRILRLWGIRKSPQAETLYSSFRQKSFLVHQQQHQQEQQQEEPQGQQEEQHWPQHKQQQAPQQQSLQQQAPKQNAQPLQSHTQQILIQNNSPTTSFVSSLSSSCPSGNSNGSQFLPQRDWTSTGTIPPRCPSTIRLCSSPQIPSQIFGSPPRSTTTADGSELQSSMLMQLNDSQTSIQAGLNDSHVWTSIGTNAPSIPPQQYPQLQRCDSRLDQIHPSFTSAGTSPPEIPKQPGATALKQAKKCWTTIGTVAPCFPPRLRNASTTTNTTSISTTTQAQQTQQQKQQQHQGLLRRSKAWTSMGSLAPPIPAKTSIRELLEDAGILNRGTNQRSPSFLQKTSSLSSFKDVQEASIAVPQQQQEPAKEIDQILEEVLQDMLALDSERELQTFAPSGIYPTFKSPPAERHSYSSNGTTSSLLSSSAKHPQDKEEPQQHLQRHSFRIAPQKRYPSQLGISTHSAPSRLQAGTRSFTPAEYQDIQVDLRHSNHIQQRRLIPSKDSTIALFESISSSSSHADDSNVRTTSEVSNVVETAKSKPQESDNMILLSPCQPCSMDHDEENENDNFNVNFNDEAFGKYDDREHETEHEQTSRTNASKRQSVLSDAETIQTGSNTARGQRLLVDSDESKILSPRSQDIHRKQPPIASAATSVHSGNQSSRRDLHVLLSSRPLEPTRLNSLMSEAESILSASLLNSEENESPDIFTEEISDSERNNNVDRMKHEQRSTSLDYSISLPHRFSPEFVDSTASILDGEYVLESEASLRDDKKILATSSHQDRTTPASKGQPNTKKHEPEEPHSPTEEVENWEQVDKDHVHESQQEHGDYQLQQPAAEKPEDDKSKFSQPSCAYISLSSSSNVQSVGDSTSERKGFERAVFQPVSREESADDGPIDDEDQEQSFEMVNESLVGDHYDDDAPTPEGSMSLPSNYCPMYNNNDDNGGGEYYDAYTTTSSVGSQQHIPMAINSNSSMSPKSQVSELTIPRELTNVRRVINQMVATLSPDELQQMNDVRFQMPGAKPQNANNVAQQPGLIRPSLSPGLPQDVGSKPQLSDDQESFDDSSTNKSLPIVGSNCAARQAQFDNPLRREPIENKTAKDLGVQEAILLQKLEPEHIDLPKNLPFQTPGPHSTKPETASRMSHILHGSHTHPSSLRPNQEKSLAPPRRSISPNSTDGAVVVTSDSNQTFSTESTMDGLLMPTRQFSKGLLSNGLPQLCKSKHCFNISLCSVKEGSATLEVKEIHEDKKHLVNTKHTEAKAKRAHSFASEEIFTNDSGKPTSTIDLDNSRFNALEKSPPNAQKSSEKAVREIRFCRDDDSIGFQEKKVFNQMQEHGSIRQREDEEALQDRDIHVYPKEYSPRSKKEAMDTRKHSIGPFVLRPQTIVEQQECLAQCSLSLLGPMRVKHAPMEVVYIVHGESYPHTGFYSGPLDDDGMMHGNGVFWFAFTGDLYLGQFWHGDLHGVGALSVRQDTSDLIYPHNNGFRREIPNAILKGCWEHNEFLGDEILFERLE